MGKVFSIEVIKMTKEEYYQKRIEALRKRNKELKEEKEALEIKLKEKEDRHDPSWDFHWDGHGSYEESRRCFYGDFG